MKAPALSLTNGRGDQPPAAHPGERPPWSWNIELRHLRYFVAVAEELHFGLAARRLHVAQPPLSRAIQHLEGQLGSALLLRTTRQVRLTPAGESFLPRARELLEMAEDAFRTAADPSARASTLAVDVVFNALLTPRLVLRQLREQHPTLLIKECTYGIPSAIERLARHELDVAMGICMSPSQHVGSELIRRERLLVALPATHPLAAADAVPLEALRDEVFLLGSDDTSPEWNTLIRQVCRSAGFAPRDGGLYARDPRAYFEWVAEGRGVTLTLASTASAMPDIALRPAADPAAECPWSMIWWDNGSISPLVPLCLAAARAAALEHGWSRPPAH